MANAQRAEHKIRRGNLLPLLAVALSGVTSDELDGATACTFELYPSAGGAPVTQAGTIDAPTKVATLTWQAGDTDAADLYEGWVAWNSESGKPGTFGPFYVLIFDPSDG